MKTLEQINEEVAKEIGYKSFISAYLIAPTKVIEKIALESSSRYAQQFQVPTDTVVAEISVMQERIAELEECLSKCKDSFDWVYENCTPPVFNNEEEADDQIEHVLYRRQEIESLINKGK